MQANQLTTSLDDIIPYQDIPDRFPHLYPKKSWAWAVKQRQHNGLSRAFHKVGKTLFVNTRVLAECIVSNKDT
ncbi:hypothetical protein [Methylomonas rosea]|uniref:Uncharacterized protein n=1 Tax=Methylomonas rosea TaxID=2952227 RepID=A0ABT1TYI2_9GAMM|nr:hypothetical protein [Methylomonas sp. WSC-7]MCQ8119831.1 hypothetical protein [Methylomonas sp. WSC-7]